MRSRAPLTGVAYAVLIVASALLTGETPGAGASADEAVDFWSDKSTEAQISAVGTALAAVFFLFFVSTLRKRLRAAEGASAGLSSVVHAAGAVAATGTLIFAGLSFTLGDAVDKLDPSSVQTLSVLNENFFLPLAGGICAMFLAIGITTIRNGGIPRWLGWGALVIGVVSMTPLGFFAYLASILWVLIAGTTLATRDEASPVAD